ARSATLGFEQDKLSFAVYRTLVDAVDAEVKWEGKSDIVESLRVIKDAGEIDRIRASIAVAERGFRSMVAKLTGKWTELQVAHELESIMRGLGASGVSFEPIVGAEPYGALCHYRPGPVSLSDTKSLLIDWGAFLDGYASDLTRTLSTHQPGGKFSTAYEIVLQAQLTAIEAIRPGIATSEVDQAARQVIESAGLGDAFKHGLGHGIGLEIHESPRLSAISSEILREGMVVTVEPGVYFEGEFGIRIEDDVLVTAEGCEVLSSLPKGLDDCRLML
ncbi:MAG: M24 family metallopeptidase, partial [Planctomycetota bacterium]